MAAHSFFSSVITPMTNRYTPKGLRSSAVSMAVAAHAPAAAASTPQGTACRSTCRSRRPLFR